MNLKSIVSGWLRHPMLRDYRLLAGLWMLLALVAAAMKMHSHNNFLIYRGTFWHLWQQTSLFAEYPKEYFDTNHYGPLFSLVVAPFAVVPEWIGLVLWCLMLTAALYGAVRQSLLTDRQQVFVLWFCAHELLTALYMQQFNIAIAAVLLLAFFLIEQERDATAAFFIVVGTLVKLYGVVGLAFFFFSKHKVRFALALAAWGVVLFCLPMAVSSPEYVIAQYGEWASSLTGKNADNMFALHQNISLLGLVRKVSGSEAYSDLWLIVPGLLLFAAAYLRRSQYRHMAFRQTMLASVLMFVVLFSTGSESSSYIIALVGVVVWYTCVPWRRSAADVALLVLVFILSSMSPSDLFPAYVRRTWVQPYALKALPVVLVWIKLCYEILTKDYAAKAVSKP